MSDGRPFGSRSTRLENLTDAVFGIAITLLIFNLANPNSYVALIDFTKTLPAFLLSIGFLALIWHEHVLFSDRHRMNDGGLVMLNTVFLALVIFFVYPLRFLTFFLTNIFFQTDIDIQIRGRDVPDLMVYFGMVVFALYLTLFLLHTRARQVERKQGADAAELARLRLQQVRLAVMFSVPLVSIGLTLALKPVSVIWSSILGGVAYNLYIPGMLLWKRYADKA